MFSIAEVTSHYRERKIYIYREIALSINIYFPLYIYRKIYIYRESERTIKIVRHTETLREGMCKREREKLRYTGGESERH